MDNELVFKCCFWLFVDVQPGIIFLLQFTLLKNIN